ncbi:Golgi-specific brefeldin A-resistance guanine nucleotide exchange factor 1, partial [Clonorchis sinensis]
MAPSNALSIVQSEISLLSTALKCNARISFRGYQVCSPYLYFFLTFQEEMKSPVYKNFVQLRSILNSVSSLNEVEPLVYLTPFLEVIRAEDVTGPITGLALTAVDKFLSYGLLEVPSTDSAEWVATHGPRSFRSVSMAVEAIADFGTQARFVGTDRSSDEVVLMKVLHLLRTLLLVPAGAFISDRAVREILQSCFRICFESKLSELLRRTAELCLTSIVQLFFSRLPSILWSSQKQWVSLRRHLNPSTVFFSCSTAEVGNPTPQPYGLPAVYDLLHYLISLLAPDHNSDAIISVALGLIAIALETGADAIASSPSLLRLVQGDLTKNLLLLLYSDRVWLFAATLRVCFMLFESMRKHLKLQLEVYLQRLIAISSPDNETTGYERREVALDSVVRIFLVPGMATELYVNYDCDPYCSNLFEDITKMLAKNAYPVERLMSTHFLALDALLAVLSTIGTNCTSPDSGRQTCSPQMGESENLEPAQVLPFRDHSVGVARVRLNRHPTDPSLLPSRDKLNAAKATKKILILGSDQFNISPKAGIAFLQKNGVLRMPLDPDEMAHFLRENPRLDKRMIGEYLSDRKNSDVLAAYVRQFNFAGVQIDEALRAYLEAFRLPGEAPLIQRLVEHFAEHWFVANNAPFVDVDSAFTLAYAILMLNTDQHNPNSKKQNVPMTLTDFKKNLSGMNGTGDFSPKLLEEIFTNIQKNEIVMPSEQLGLVRENYLWKCLLRRAATSQANFVHVQTGTLDADLFDLIWGPTVSALSFIFDKTIDPAVQNKVVHGFIRCAAIAAHHGMSDVLDNLVISLCKFTTLLTTAEPPTGLPVYIGRNAKGRLALRLVFALTSSHADILRYGWHSLLDCLLQLFRAGLLPDELTESEDFLAPSRRVRLTTKGCIPIPDVKTGKLGRTATGTEQSGRELSVLTSFYQYLTSGSGWIGSDREDEPDEPTHNTQQKAAPDGSCVDVKHISNTDFLMDDQLGFGYWMDAPASAQLDEHRAARVALDTVRQCEIGQLIKDSKFLVDASLAELIKALLRAIRGDDCAVVNASNSNLFFEPTATTHCDEPGISHAHSIPALSNRADANSQSVPPGTEDTIIVPSSPPVEQSLRRSMTLPSSTSYYPAFCATGGTPSEDCRIFCLELLIRILLYNRDRVSNLWPFTQCYLADVLLTAAEPSPLTERVVVGFLRLAICLLRRHEMTCQIFACLHYILLTRGDHLLLDCYQAVAGTATTVDRSKPVAGQYRNQSKNTVGLQIIAGLTHLLRNHATDLPDPASDWQLIFSLIDVCGAGLRAAPLASHRHSSRQTHYSSMHDIASDRVPLSSPHVSRGYTSDSEATDYCTSFPSDSMPAAQPIGEEKQAEKRAMSLDDASVHSPTAPPAHLVKTHHLVPSHLLGLHITIGSRDPVTMRQAADCLDFLIRDPTFITPDNFE